MYHVYLVILTSLNKKKKTRKKNNCVSAGTEAFEATFHQIHPLNIIIFLYDKFAYNLENVSFTQNLFMAKIEE